MIIELKDWFELLSYAATILGIPLAIYVFYKDKQQEKKIKEKEVLFTSHSLYVDYLKLCLENPDLDVYNNHSFEENLTGKRKKEIIIFEILFTYLESAYLYYADLSDEIKRKRWDGWVRYIEEFFRQESFRNAWQITEGQWDADFLKFMNSIMKKVIPEGKNNL